MNMYAQNRIVVPPVVKNLLIINLLVFFAEIMLPIGVRNWISDNWSLHFFRSDEFNVGQLFTYMFMHANFTHLFFNMLALWMFGRILEYDMGSRRFLVYYLMCGIGAGIIQLGAYYIDYMSLVGNYSPASVARWANDVSTVGASGAVFGLLLAFGMIHPNNIIMLMFPPVALKAKWFVVIYGVVELLLGIRGGGGVAHFAHVGGMLWGWILLRYWRRRNEIYY